MSSRNQQEIATPDKKVATVRSLTKTLTYLATLCALCILLKYISNLLSQGVPLSFKISLSYVGWFSAAIIAGPTGGFGVAVISDLLGQLIMPTGGAPNPILLAGYGIATFVFGLIYHYLPLLKNKGFAGKAVRAVLGAVAFALVGTLGLNTFGMWLYYYRSVDYLAFFVTRFVQLVMWGANLAVTVALVPAINALKLEYVPPKTHEKTLKATEEKQPENDNKDDDTVAE